MRYLKLSFVFTLINYLLILAIFTLRLGGDDWQQLQYVSGTLISDEPAEFLIYTHICIGLLLKSLYLYNSHIAWYAIYLLSAMFLASWGILFALLRFHFSYLRIAIFFLFFYTVQVQHILFLQYTIVSAYATIAGFLLIFSAIKQKNKYVYCMAFFMLLMAFLIRSSGFLLTLATCLPALAFYLYRFRLTYSAKYVLAFSILLGAVIFLFYQFELSYYAKHGQIDRLEMNHKLSYFYNYEMLNYDQYEELYKKVGFSRDDFIFGLDLYNYLDKDVFSPQKIDKLLANNDTYSWKVMKMRGFKECFWNIITILKSDFVVYKIFLPALLLLPFVGFDKQKFGLFALILCNILLGLAGLYLFRSIKYSPEMMMPFLFALVIFEAHQTRKSLIYYGISLFCLYGAFSMKDNFARSKENEQMREDCRYFFNYLDSNKLYILWNSTAHLEGLDAFEDITPYQSKHLVLIAYYTDAPTVQKKLARFGVKNINKDMIDREDILFLANKRESVAYLRYMKEHYPYELSLVSIRTIFDFSIYKVVRKDVQK